MKTRFTIAAVTISAILALSGCAAATPETKAPNGSSAITPPPAATSTSSKTNIMDQQTLPPAAGDKIAIIETDLGTIKVKLFPEQAPESVKNMEELASSGKYKDVPFHRVAENAGQPFVIQTGDFSKKDGSGGYSYKGPGTYIPNEISMGLRHIYGALGMARTSLPDTNGSQFYFVTNKIGTPFLDGGYTVFGQIYEGLDVLDAIAAVETDPATDRPLKDILVKSVEVISYTK